MATHIHTFNAPANSVVDIDFRLPNSVCEIYNISALANEDPIPSGYQPRSIGQLNLSLGHEIDFRYTVPRYDYLYDDMDGTLKSRYEVDTAQKCEHPCKSIDLGCNPRVKGYFKNTTPYTLQVKIYFDYNDECTGYY